MSTDTRAEEYDPMGELRARIRKLRDLEEKRERLTNEWVNAGVDPDHPLAKTIDALDVEISKCNDPFVEAHAMFKKMSRTEIGGLFAWYISEALAGSFEGFNADELSGARHLISDVMTFYKFSKVGDHPTDFAKDTYFTGSEFLTTDMEPDAGDNA